MLKITLSHIRLPREPEGNFYAQADAPRTSNLKVTDLLSASEAFCAWRDRHGIGRDDLGDDCGVVALQDDTPIARISYDGRMYLWCKDVPLSEDNPLVVDELIGREIEKMQAAIGSVRASSQGFYSATDRRFIERERTEILAAIERAKVAGVLVDYFPATSREGAEQWFLKRPKLPSEAGDPPLLLGYLLSREPSGRTVWHVSDVLPVEPDGGQHDCAVDDLPEAGTGGTKGKARS
jgi:hypothetical protein